MTNPLADYDAAIADLHEEMQPLRDRLTAVSRERREFADALAEETDDLQVLADLREASQIAYSKLASLVRGSTHPAIWTFTDWLAIEDDYSDGYLMGPSLAADRIPTDSAGIASLVGSMSDFAARFCNPAPALAETTATRHACVDVSDMVFAEISAMVTEGYADYGIYYAPDGSQAYLLNSFAFGEVALAGSLAEVLVEVTRLAKVARSRSHEDEY